MYKCKPSAYVAIAILLLTSIGSISAAVDSSKYGHWNDDLTAEEAEGRFDWLETCTRGVLIEFWESMYGYNSQVDAQEKIDQLRDLWLTHKGKKAEFPYYLTFGDENHQNPKNWYAGIISDDATPVNCTTIPEGYAPIGLLKSKNTKRYCKVTGASEWEYIKEVAIDDIVNESGSQDYSNFTSPVFSLKAGTDYKLKVTPGFHSDEIYEEGWTAFIDWNQDGFFDTSTELVLYETWTQGTVEASFLVPSNAKTGYTKMRVSLDATSGDPNSCQNIMYGEIEDYYVNITN